MNPCFWPDVHHRWETCYIRSVNTCPGQNEMRGLVLKEETEKSCSLQSRVADRLEGAPRVRPSTIDVAVSRSSPSSPDRCSSQTRSLDGGDYAWKVVEGRNWTCHSRFLESPTWIFNEHTHTVSLSLLLTPLPVLTFLHPDFNPFTQETSCIRRSPADHRVISRHLVPSRAAASRVAGGSPPSLPYSVDDKSWCVSGGTLAERPGSVPSPVLSVCPAVWRRTDVLVMDPRSLTQSAVKGSSVES